MALKVNRTLLFLHVIFLLSQQGRVRIRPYSFLAIKFPIYLAPISKTLLGKHGDVTSETWGDQPFEAFRPSTTLPSSRLFISPRSRIKIVNKIFCIGFHKTGTSSLGLALAQLGYRVKGPVHTRDPRIAEHLLEMALPLVEQYDAFQDNPWPILYRTLDERYPGSKFILTVRDPGAWLKSTLGHFGDKSTPMRHLIYGAGCPLGHEETYLNRYVRHELEVREYFRNRPQDLLILDLKLGNSWQALCEFLDKPIPDSPFPHANPGKTRKLEKNPRWKTFLRRIRGKLPYV